MVLCASLLNRYGLTAEQSSRYDTCFQFFEMLANLLANVRFVGLEPGPSELSLFFGVVLATTT